MMKLKTLLIAVAVLFSFQVNAGQNVHSKQHTQGVKQEQFRPGYCEIEIKNTSYEDAFVYATYNDGCIVPSFRVRSFDAPHYIDLYHGNYCNPGMNINIYTWDNILIYSAYTLVNNTIYIYPSAAMSKKPAIRVEAK
jgi:hypothetical protein